MRRALLPGLALAVASMGLAHAADAARTVSFVACPIARDTGPDTDLCFFAEHAGRRYALTNPADFGQPQLRHKVLVEARIAQGPDVCGGTPIDGRVSVLAEVDLGCNEVVPFDGSVRGVAGGVFNSGTPEQRQRALDLARRAEADPSLSVVPAQPEPPPPTPPQPPFSVQTLTVYFPFDSDRGSGPDMLQVMRLVDYAKASRAKVEVVGTRGASRLSDGTVMTERAGMARRRAEKLVDILTGLGLDRSTVAATWQETPPRPRGDEDWRTRRIELRVTPG